MNAFQQQIGNRRLAVVAVLALSVQACATNAPPVISSSSAETWQCRNDIEIRCAEGACSAAASGSFTPMSVSADGTGRLSVCAYSGCWEGIATVTRSEQKFLMLVGQNLEFSTASAQGESTQDVVLVIDRRDSVAILKVAEFAHPLICKSG